MSIPYVAAVCIAEDSNQLDRFLADYGPESEWVDPTDGTPIRVDRGEFLNWLREG